MSGPDDPRDPDPGFDPDRYIDAVAPALNLTVTPDQRAGVTAFLVLAARMARVAAAAPIAADTQDLAPVFTPGDRNRGPA